MLRHFSQLRNFINFYSIDLHISKMEFSCWVMSMWWKIEWLTNQAADHLLFWFFFVPETIGCHFWSAAQMMLQMSDGPEPVCSFISPKVTNPFKSVCQNTSTALPWLISYLKYDMDLKWLCSTNIRWGWLHLGHFRPYSKYCSCWQMAHLLAIIITQTYVP